MEIRLAYNDLTSVKELFTEYTDMLCALDEEFRGYLQIQHFDDELRDLNKKYGLPRGRIYIAYVDGQAAGCIALRQMSETECEMKRLFVRPQFRGQKIATALAELLVKDAKELGYKFMLLDTSPQLSAAIAMYEKMGFYKIAQYNDNPSGGDAVYLRLDL